MEDIIEEEESYDEEDKFEQLMNDLTDYCNHYQLPLFTHDNTYTILKTLLNIDT